MSAGPEVDRALSLRDFELLARDHVSQGAWARIQGGAADEITLREAAVSIGNQDKHLLSIGA